jgi:hypothetical protein
MKNLALPKFALPLLSALILALPLAAQTPPPDADTSQPTPLTSMEATGTLGPYRIGLNYTVGHNTQLAAAHYFYATQLKNIPLTGTVTGDSVQLHGTDGSNFELHFVGNGSDGKQPLTFDTSVGLRGTWSLNNRTLPVQLAFAYSTENPGQRLYSQVTSQPDAAFEAMVSAAMRAILTGDAAAAANYVHFPLIVYAQGHRVVLANASALKTQWSTAFTAPTLAKLHSDIPHEMFVHDGRAALGDGELWFDSKGLVSINPVAGTK